MKSDILPKALALSEKLDHVFIATASGDGMPHMAAAAKLGRISDDMVSVEAWFCPGTVENLNHNNRIAIVVWQPDPDPGYQLTGKVRKEAAMDNMETSSTDELRCEEKCVYEWVECEDELEGDPICKTRERNCFGECEW